MRKSRNKEINVYGASFMDVLANTIGGLAFLLILAIIMIGSLVFVPPKIMTEQLPPAYNETDYEVWVGAREGLGKFVWRLGEGELPKDLELDSLSGRLHGTPVLPENADARATYEFEVLCTVESDGGGEVQNQDAKSYELTVLRKSPETVQELRILTDSPLPKAYVNQPYPLTFAAEGGTLPYAWEAEGNFPAGLQLNSDGRITGQPEEEGAFPVTVRVHSANGGSHQKDFTLDVAINYPPPPPVPPLRILTSSLADAIARRDYAFYPSADGGVPPYTWSIVSAIPAWLNSAGDGFAGQPALEDISESHIVLKVRDSKGTEKESQPMSLTVLPPPGEVPPPLELTTASLPDSITDHEYRVAFAARGGYPPYTWDVSGDFSPAGLDFSQQDATLQGFPADAGKYHVSCTVRDRFNTESSSEFDFEIVPAVPKPVILTEAVPPGRAGAPYAMAFAVNGGYPPYTWSLASGKLPPGLTLDPAGLVAGKPADAGDYEFAVEMTDLIGQKLKSVPYRMRVYTTQGFQKFEVKTKSLPTLLTGQGIDIALACQGGEPPYVWESLGNLPPGIQMSPDGLTGSPAKVGEYTVNLAVKDASGESAQVAYAVAVRRVVDWWIAVVFAVLAALFTFLTVILFIRCRLYARKATDIVVTTKSLPNARASADYCVYLACEGGVAPYKWAVVDGELPQGLQLSPEGVISGKPYEGIEINETTDRPFTVEVTDAVGKKATQQL